MNITPHVTALEEQLAAVAATADEETRKAAGLLATALEPAARLALMNALAELAAEVTDALGDRVVELRLDVDEVRVAVTPSLEPEPELPAGAGGEQSRITLRISEELKARAEEAAEARSLSLNTWLTQAVARALRPAGEATRGGEGSRSTQRLRGWVQG